MKKLIMSVFILLSLTTVQSKTITENGGDGYFYTALAPYGEWIELNDGMTVWQPTMMPRNWEPYTIGRWEWTADGWYWDSDEPFGYITYHYGRWYNDDYYGWIWVPDDQWAPAWVDWRYDDDYVGWAPLSPYGEFRIGFGLYFTNEYHAPYSYWNFVAYNHFCDHNVYHYYAGPTYKYGLYNGTRFRNDYDYSNGRVINRGVGYDLVRERGGRPIRTSEIIRSTDPREVTGNRDRNIIKTYVATRQDISRDNIRDITIKRPNRGTTMDVSRVNIGGRNISGRNDVIGDRQRQQQSDQLNLQRQQDVQRQQPVDQQNRQKQQVQQRQNVDQQSGLRQQVRQRQNINQQNRQRQQVQPRQNVNQQNRQRQQVQPRQNVNQPNRQRPQAGQKRQQTNQRNETRDNGKDRK